MSIRRNQGGEINVLLVPLILVTLLLFGAAGFGYWAYGGYQDYKNNSDQKAAAAAQKAKVDEGIAKDKAFVEAEKNPLTSYDGPESYGSIHVEYPKTWSVYVNSQTTSDQPLDAYFNPRFVPSIDDPNSVFSARIQVVQTTYTGVLSIYTSSVKLGTVTITPYSLPKVAGVVGARIDGLIRPGKKNTGSMIVLPLRDKTLEIWTENAQAMGDFNNIILPNMSFSP